MSLLTKRFLMYTAGPNTAMVKSSGKRDVRIVIGGRMLCIPVLERVDLLSLSLRTLSVHTAHGLTVNGVELNVTSCCQVKIQGWRSEASESPHVDESAIRLAAQHFLGKSEADINDTIQKTVAGHQRAIIGTLTVEELYRDRALFCERVVTIVSDDMRNMGLAVVSYTLAEIADDQGYLEALSVTQTERIKRDAQEGAALHRAQRRMHVNEAEMEAHVFENGQHALKVKSDRDTIMLRANMRENLNRWKAIAKKAQPIALATEDERLLVLVQEAAAAQANAGLAVGEALVKREVLEKEKNVNVQADAELYAARAQADAVRVAAAAEAECVRLLGEAEASASRMKGLAEVDILRSTNKAWTESMNAGAVLEKMIDVMPEIAREIAKPLENTEKMVFISGGEESHGSAPGQGVRGGNRELDFADQITRLVAEVPETVGAIMDVDLVDVFQNMMCGSTGDAIVQGAAEGIATALVEKRTCM